jgi:hypothetical protein
VAGSRVAAAGEWASRVAVVVWGEGAAPRPRRIGSPGVGGRPRRAVRYRSPEVDPTRGAGVAEEWSGECCRAGPCRQRRGDGRPAAGWEADAAAPRAGGTGGGARGPVAACLRVDSARVGDRWAVAPQRQPTRVVDRDVHRSRRHLMSVAVTDEVVRVPAANPSSRVGHPRRSHPVLPSCPRPPTRPVADGGYWCGLGHRHWLAELRPN